MYFRRNDPAVSKIVDAAFPNAAVQQVKVDAREVVSFYGRQWDGGSKENWAIIDLASFKMIPLPDSPYLARDAFHADFNLTPGLVVVQWTEGYRQSIRLLVHPSMMPTYLPEPVKFTMAEQVVLVITRTRVASYNGMNRLQAACKETGLAPAAYEEAKRSLIARGFLSKQGGITVEGRNACPPFRDVREVPGTPNRPVLRVGDPRLADAFDADGSLRAAGLMVVSHAGDDDSNGGACSMPPDPGDVHEP